MSYDLEKIPDWEKVHVDHRAAVIREIQTRVAELFAQNAAAMQVTNASRILGETGDDLGGLVTEVVSDHTAQLLLAYVAALKKLEG